MNQWLMYSPDFSIIIPTYNRVEKLHFAVKSVINQTYENWELIIIDDGSKDATKLQLSDYLKMKNVFYEYQDNSGVSAARNRGLKKAAGEYVIFLDSDDFMKSNLLETLIAHDYQIYDIIFWYIKKNRKKDSIVWKPEKLEIIYNNIKASFIPGSACYKRQILLNAGGFDEGLEFGENYELGMRLAQDVDLKTLIIPKILHEYNLQKYRPHSEPETKLKSLHHILSKHENVYSKDKYSYSRLLYQIGYLYEKLGHRIEAIYYYSKAFDVNKLYLKAILKYYYLKLISSMDLI